MDNCSSDGTSDVCREFESRLPKMKVHRHSRNVGFGANFMRSLELSQGEYTWVLCDDDTLFPENADSLLELLARSQPPACFVGGPRQEEWPAGCNLSPAEIQSGYGTFLTAQSFVPALVFKSSLVGSREMFDGYSSIRIHFPQCVIGRKLLTEDIPCAVLQPPLIRRDDPEERTYNQLSTFDGWSSFCKTLPPAVRKVSFYSIYARPDQKGMVKELMRNILWAKIDGFAEPGYYITRIGLNGDLSDRIALTFCRMACLIPGKFFKIARDIYRAVKYGWLKKPLPPNYHAPVATDVLRR